MTLLNLIKKDPSMRVLFGKQELMIMEKQLLGVKLKKSEVTRLSRDIRKKLNAIKQIAEHSSEFDLKKGRYIKDMIEDAKKVILDTKYYNKIKKIVLFGSTIENQRTFRSDIDIAVEFSDITLREATKFRIHVSGRVNDRVDIQVFNVLPKKIKNSILKNHKVLYQK